jgi:hypothetical protein
MVTSICSCTLTTHQYPYFPPDLIFMCSDLMSSHLKKLYKIWGTQNLAFKHETAPIDILHVPDFDTQYSSEIQEQPTPITFISISTSPTAPNPISIRILPLPPPPFFPLRVIYSFLFLLSPPISNVSLLANGPTRCLFSSPFQLQLPEAFPTLLASVCSQISQRL